MLAASGSTPRRQLLLPVGSVIVVGQSAGPKPKTSSVCASDHPPSGDGRDVLDQYCPVDAKAHTGNLNGVSAFMESPGVHDLNSAGRFGETSGIASAGGLDERRQDAVRPGHGVPAVEDLRPDRGPLLWRSSGAHAQVRRAVPMYGLRPAHLSGEPARHRSLFVGTSGEALPHGVSRAGQSLHLGRRQRSARLAHLRRFRPGVDRAGEGALRSRRLRGRAGEHRLRARRHHHRPLPVGVSPGRRFVPPRPQ